MLAGHARADGSDIVGIVGPGAGRLAAVATVTGAACCALLGLAAATPATAAASPAASAAAVPAAVSATGVWGPVHDLPGTPALDGVALPAVLSCDGPGDCVAAGSATYPPQPPSPNGPAVEAVAEEKRGVWGEASMTPGLASLAAAQFDTTITVTAVSCGSPGNCAVGGYYMPYSAVPIVWYAFLATERNGRWGNAEDVPGLEALDNGDQDQITAISCTAAGDCTAAGFVTLEFLTDADGGEQDGFVIDEKNGRWGNARLVPGITIKPGEIAQALALSCASPGNCAAGGYAPDSDVPFTADDDAFIAEEKNGAWQRARLIPAMTSVTALSCPAAGDCAAAGDSGSAACASTPGCPAAYVSEKNGTWGTPHTVLSARQAQTLASSITSLSCGAPGDCVAGGSTGSYNWPGPYNEQAFLLEEKNGTWGTYRKVPGTAALNSGGGATVSTVSCPAAGDCDAGGYYTNTKGDTFGFLSTETGGAWGRLIPVSAGAVDFISCFSPVSCAAVVNDTGVMEKEPVQSTRITLALSAARVSYSREQAARATVTVTAALGDPGGRVLVDSGTTTVCVIRLVSGTGSCGLTSEELKPGTYRLVARYPGTISDDASASARLTLTVTPRTLRFRPR
jgi:hypothetical protein